MLAETNPTADNALAVEAQKAFENLTSFRVIRATTRFIPGIPFWLRALLFCLVFTAIWEGGLWLAHEQDIAYWAALFSVMNGLVTMVAFEIIGRDMLRILREDIAPHASPEIMKQAAWNLRNNFTTLKQVISIIISAGLLLLTCLVALFLTPTIEFRALPLIVVGLYAMFVLVIPVFHLAVLFVSTALLFTKDEAALYPLDPRRSPIVQALTAMTQQIVLFFALLGTLVVITSASVASALRLLIIAVVVIVAATFVMVSGLFILQQTRLSRLIASRRARTLSELQAELKAFYDQRGNLDDAAQKRFDYLLALHDRVAHTSDLAIDLGGALRFFSPMLLPLLSLLFSNIDLPFLTQDIRNLLQRVLSQH